MNHFNKSQIVPYSLFREVCLDGLSKVRPLRPGLAKDQWGWNFGAAAPPSYWAYGRMRFLLALQYASMTGAHRILEVAAGDGALCASLEMRGCDVTANDLRAKELETALGSFENARSIKMVEGDIFALNENELGKFDLVIACEIIEHVAHTDRFLAQLRRLVASGGYCLITTPNGEYFRNKLPTHSQVSDFTALEKDQFKPDADGHLFLLTPSELCSIAEKAGFIVQELSVWGTPFLTGNCKLSLFSSRRLIRIAHAIEIFVQHFVAPIRTKLCTAMTIVLRVD